MILIGLNYGRYFQALRTKERELRLRTPSLRQPSKLNNRLGLLHKVLDLLDPFTFGEKEEAIELADSLFCMAQACVDDTEYLLGLSDTTGVVPEGIRWGNMTYRL